VTFYHIWQLSGTERKPTPDGKRLVHKTGHQELDNSQEDIALSFSPSLSFFGISFLFFLLLIDATNIIIGP
jgi:hypothetical protein